MRLALLSLLVLAMSGEFRDRSRSEACLRWLRSRALAGPGS
jgi:hypothetical protein